MRDRNTGHPRGFGFVTYEQERVADRVATARHELDGRQVEAKRAVPKSECTPTASTNPSSNSKFPATHASTQFNTFSPVSVASASLHLGAPPSPSSAKVTPVVPASTQHRATRKIFVGGLPAACDDDSFRAYFNTFGTVVESQVMYDHHTGNSRGFGFVTFAEETAVDLVVEFAAETGSQHELLGKFVEVKRAEPKQVMDAKKARAAAAAAAAAAPQQVGPPHQLPSSTRDLLVPVAPGKNKPQPPPAHLLVPPGPFTSSQTPASKHPPIPSLTAVASYGFGAFSPSSGSRSSKSQPTSYASAAATSTINPANWQTAALTKTFPQGDMYPGPHVFWPGDPRLSSASLLTEPPHRERRRTVLSPGAGSGARAPY